MKHRIRISKDGITFIYHDQLERLAKLPGAVTKRVSNVEPTPDGQWTAFMIEDQKLLGPYSLRQQALNAEKEYLERKMFGGQP